jgi:hypothetical protein
MQMTTSEPIMLSDTSRPRGASAPLLVLHGIADGL